jgi:PAS domain S-box-containing protein
MNGNTAATGGNEPQAAKREEQGNDRPLGSFVQDILDHLGNINWGTGGLFNPSVEIDPAHPFKPVFEAISLIRSDIELSFQERKFAEEELRESEDRFKSLSQNAPDIIYTLDVDGTFTYVNPAWERILGYKRREVIGKYLHDFADEETRNTIRNFRGIMDRKEIVRDLTITLAHRDGSPRIFDMSGAPNFNSSGMLIGIVGLLKDVTEHRKLEVRFQQAQKMEAVGTLAGGIAHDFNNLLMGIQGYVSLMLLDFSSGHAVHEKLKMIEQQVKSGADLTRQLLAFARAGKYQIKPTDLNELIDRTAALFGRTKKEIRIHEKFQPGLWTVEADQIQIKQVLLNLYINAWQAMPGGGDLYLETSNMVLDEAFAAGSGIPPGRYVRISVTDTGIGMDEKVRKRIFEPFFTTKEMGRGTGLGLASAYGIIKGHDGIIDVYSEKGCGSTFNIYLPASEKVVRKEQKAPDPFLTGSETILLVDDEQVILDVNREMLEKLGYRVLTAKGGREAIDAFRANTDIHVVILDMIMPDLSGREVFNALREMNPSVRVILSSGYSLSDEAARIMESGCRSFIQKPFSISELSTRIRRVLDEP